ncbi:MAG: hypothetical protein IT518_02685 [Burkholderiales bacterium]|nr:hypothetical protein [Burkholderiales bacterium]
MTAIVPRSKEQVPEAAYRRLLRVDTWEVVLALVCIIPGAATAKPVRARGDALAAVDANLTRR